MSRLLKLSPLITEAARLFTDRRTLVRLRVRKVLVFGVSGTVVAKVLTPTPRRSLSRFTIRAPSLVVFIGGPGTRVTSQLSSPFRSESKLEFKSLLTGLSPPRSSSVSVEAKGLLVKASPVPSLRSRSALARVASATPPGRAEGRS